MIKRQPALRLQPAEGRYVDRGEGPDLGQSQTLLGTQLAQPSPHAGVNRSERS
jgi:hypothetical protein